MTIDSADVRARLTARKAELEGLRDLSSDARDTVQLDQQSVGRLSRMDAMQQQAMAAATERQRKAELARIAQAFARLDDGEYGYCDRCGKEIAASRLAVDPSALLCVGCART
ncbi:MAG: TraR/DksA C4-type zinc finger protein [Pseudomonadota bacterium]